MRSSNTLRRLALILAVAALALYVVLGIRVDGRGPLPIDQLGFAIRGESLGVAWFLTQLGLWPSLVAFAAGALLIAVRKRFPVAPVIALFASETISQGVLAYGKHAFNRARPLEYFGPHLHDLSYASGHAATSVMFYGGLAILANRAVPRTLTRALLSGALVLLALGIMWSRLALGAHYLSDVCGGAAFGAGWLALSLVAWPSIDSMITRLRERRYESRRISAG